jgi:hypothetical protein
MIYTRKKIGAMIAATTLYGMSATPAHAGWIGDFFSYFWDRITTGACLYACDGEWLALQYSCGTAGDILYAGCLLGVANNSPEETQACFASTYDFMQNCIGIADWEHAECLSNCA